MKLNLIDKMRMFPLKLEDFKAHCKGYSDVLAFLHTNSLWYKGHLLSFNIRSIKGLCFKISDILRYGER